MRFFATVVLVLFVVFGLNLNSYAAGETIYWISDAQDASDDPDGIPSDQEWIDFLEDMGYIVNYEYGYEMASGQGFWVELEGYKLDELEEKADLLIISRTTNSGDYANDIEEVMLWNSITKPILMMTAYIVRSSRWQWLNTGSTMDVADTMEVIEPDHFIFQGVPTIEENKIAVLDTGWTSANTSFPVTSDPGYGTLLAARADTGGVWIVEWPPNFEFYDYTDQFPEGPRMFFALGEAGGSNTAEIGYKNTTEAGDMLFLNAIKYMVGDTLESAVESKVSIAPTECELLQNYPNPFNPTTSISFILNHDALVQLNVYDVNGRIVADLINARMTAGHHRIDFNAAHLQSGIYFCKLTTPDISLTRKMTLVR